MQVYEARLPTDHVLQAPSTEQNLEEDSGAWWTGNLTRTSLRLRQLSITEGECEGASFKVSPVTGWYGTDKMGKTGKRWWLSKVMIYRAQGNV